MYENDTSGEVNCLGWCSKKFISPNKKKIRFCPTCRTKRDSAAAGASRSELRQIGRSVGTPTVRDE